MGIFSNNNGKELNVSEGISVSSGGRITGNIVAKSVFVDGEVSGDILAEKVEIGEKGKVLANVVSTLFIIQEGGLFEGNKKMKKAEAYIEYEEASENSEE